MNTAKMIECFENAIKIATQEDSWEHVGMLRGIKNCCEICPGIPLLPLKHVWARAQYRHDLMLQKVHTQGPMSMFKTLPTDIGQQIVLSPVTIEASSIEAAPIELPPVEPVLITEQGIIRKTVQCMDGTTISVQASSSHYCTPRNNVGPYSHVEVGYPSVAPPDSWREYCENWDAPTNTVYADVPKELVWEYITAHGGAKSLLDTDDLKKSPVLGDPWVPSYPKANVVTALLMVNAICGVNNDVLKDPMNIAIEEDRAILRDLENAKRCTVCEKCDGTGEVLETAQDGGECTNCHGTGELAPQED